ncbi:MAG TPA: ABC transporter ATP-binding protein [Anaeromyxobacteraceae bacterium]|nr:ABC transporter ATP-binding protein [Anaeromyxobacteraceae bacterium]
MRPDPERLVLEGVERAFGGVRAVDGVSFTIGEREIHGLIGPNGAGKTTLLNLVSGLVRPTGGAIRLGRDRLDRLPPHRIAALGVTRTFQNIRVFPELSALENVIVGSHLTRVAPLWRHMLFLGSARAEEAETRARALSLLRRVGMAERAEEPASSLSYGEQRRVEIARALAASPAVLLLDEPTAGMNPAEVASVGEVIREVARGGQSVLLVEHNVKLVMDVCHRVTVLDFGKVIAEGTPAEVSRNPDVIAVYLGGEA